MHILDMLTLVDTKGMVLYRVANPNQWRQSAWGFIY